MIVQNSVLRLAMAGAMAVVDLAVREVVDRIVIKVAERVVSRLVKAQVKRTHVKIALIPAGDVAIIHVKILAIMVVLGLG